MVQIDRISKSYGDRLLFSDVTFSIGRRERIAIAGRNGSGKSTLLRILTDEESYDEGEIRLPKGLRIGSLPQHLKFNEKTLIEEAVLGLPPEERDLQYKVEIILEGLGFSDDDFLKPPHSFSGGYQLRLALCKVLAADPDLLLLDEPTNYLDILAIRWLEKFLIDWRGELVLISHDRTFVNKVCTHVVGLKRGKAKKIKGNLKDYFEMIQIQEEAYEKKREKVDKKKKHMMAFVDRFGAKATKAAQAQSRLKAIEKLGEMEALQEEQNLLFRFNYKRNQSQKVLDFKKANFSFSSQEKLIHNLGFELGNGERLAIIGKNGSGKSTILRLIAGELLPVSGDVALGGNTELGYFGQTNIERLNGDNRIEEELTHAFPSAPYAKVRAACGAMLFSGDDAKKPINVLSGGERSRVLLAKILLTPSNLLLLDEPTHHLDVESVAALMEAISRFEGSVVLVTHDEDVLHRYNPHKLIICHDQRQQFFLGNYQEFLETQGWEEESF